MIKLFITDFDGVLSDGKVLFSEGECLKSYNTKDGCAINILRNSGVKVGLISGYKPNKATQDIASHLKFDYVEIGAKNKVQIAKEWMAIENIGWDQVSYIGDCDNDVELMKMVQKSACPSDAIQSCHDIADFHCKRKGGKGCVREFTDYIIEYNRRWNSKITAIIPVRDGSTRCVNKNIRKFNDSSCLTKKINTLKQVEEINDIVVSTNCAHMLQMARDQGVSVHVREDKFCNNDSAASDVFVCLAESIQDSAMLFTVCPMPFISVETYRDMIRKWRSYPEHDSVLLSTPVHEWLNDGKQPINYDRGSQTRTQDIRGINVTLSCSLSDTDVIIDNNNITGKTPLYMDCDELNAIDIDTPIEFLTSEYLDLCGFKSVDEVVRYTNNIVRDKHIQLLDCTIRDGGFVNQWDFSIENVKERVKIASETGIEYIEIGFFSEEKNCSPWRSMTAELTKSIVDELQPKCKLTAMIDCWRFDPDNIPPRSETGLSLIRVCTLMDYIDNQAVEMCRNVKEKGYEVSLNVLRISHRNNEHDIQKIKDVMDNNRFIDILCLPDSFGAMQPNKLRSFLINFVGRHYKVGFHAHNNGGIAMGNVLTALDVGVDILDGTYHSMGRGGGNLNLIDVLLYLHLHSSQQYNMKVFLDYIDQSSSSDERDKVLYAISGFLSVHPTRLEKVRKDKTVWEIFSCLKNTPLKKREFYCL